MSNVERLERVRGTTSKEVCLRLSKLAEQVPGDQAVVEIGVYEGRATCFLAHGARHGNGAHVYGIDAWSLVEEYVVLPFNSHRGKIRVVRERMKQSHTRARKNISLQGMSRYITLIHGPSIDVASAWVRGEIGLLIIDGDSRVESVKNDVAAWFPYLAHDATIVFENYDPSTPEGENIVTAANQLVNAGVIRFDESDDLPIALARPVTVALPEPGQAGPLRLQEETVARDVAHEEAGKVEVTPVGPVEPHDFAESDGTANVKSELDAFAAEMGIEERTADASGPLPPAPESGYPPDATPLPEPEYEDNPDDAASSQAQHVAEHPDAGPATNDPPADEGRSEGDLKPLGVVFDDMNVKQLREHAEKIGADVKGIYKRDEVLTKIHERQRYLDAADELGQLGQELGT